MSSNKEQKLNKKLDLLSDFARHAIKTDVEKFLDRMNCDSYNEITEEILDEICDKVYDSIVVKDIPDDVCRKSTNIDDDSHYAEGRSYNVFYQEVMKDAVKSVLNANKCSYEADMFDAARIVCSENLIYPAGVFIDSEHDKLNWMPKSTVRENLLKRRIVDDVWYFIRMVIDGDIDRDIKLEIAERVLKRIMRDDYSLREENIVANYRGYLQPLYEYPEIYYDSVLKEEICDVLLKYGIKWNTNEFQMYHATWHAVICSQFDPIVRDKKHFNRVLFVLKKDGLKDYEEHMDEICSKTKEALEYGHEFFVGVKMMDPTYEDYEKDKEKWACYLSAPFWGSVYLGALEKKDAFSRKFKNMSDIRKILPKCDDAVIRLIKYIDSHSPY